MFWSSVLFLFLLYNVIAGIANVISYILLCIVCILRRVFFRAMRLQGMTAAPPPGYIPPCPVRPAFCRLSLKSPRVMSGSLAGCFRFVSRRLAAFPALPYTFLANKRKGRIRASDAFNILLQAKKRAKHNAPLCLARHLFLFGCPLQDPYKGLPGFKYFDCPAL